MIKCFIINRDLWTWPQAMVEAINTKWGTQVEPIILDNASTAPNCLAWYDTNPCRVIRLSENYGHKVLWSSGLFHSEVKEDYYIVTDPDLDISHLPDDTIDKLISGLQKFNTPKCGLAIQIDDLPDAYPLKEQVLIWETPFWQHSLGDDFYGAPLDTTFALHLTRDCRNHIIGGIRTGGAYTCKHLPFYITADNITEELAYYFDHSNKQVSSQAKHLNQWVQNCYLAGKNK